MRLLIALFLLIGTDASFEIQIPYNSPLDERTAILVGRGPLRDLYRREILPPIDQYAAQAEAFAQAVLGDKSTLQGAGVEDAIKQLRVLDAIFRSEKSGAWETV